MCSHTWDDRGTETREEVRELVGRAMLPLAALGTSLHAEAVGYVMDGSCGEVLDRLVREGASLRHDVLTPRSLLRPGSRLRGGVSEAAREALERVGVAWPADVPTDSVEPVHWLRDAVYRDAGRPACREPLHDPGGRAQEAAGTAGGTGTGPEGTDGRAGVVPTGALGADQWIRWAEVLRTADTTAARAGRAAEPAWFRTLVDDVLATCPEPDEEAGTGVERLRRLRPVWGADLLAHLLVSAGVPGEQVPRMLLEACWSGPVISQDHLSTLSIPGSAHYLSRYWELALPSGAEELSPHQQQVLLTVLHQERPVPTALASPLAGMGVSPRREVRAAALAVLADVAPEAAVAALGTAVSRVGPHQAEEPLTFLLTVGEDGTALTEAVARNPRLAALAEHLRKHHVLLAEKAGAGRTRQSGRAEEPSPEVPPFTPLPGASAAPAARELRLAVERLVREGQGGGPWARALAERAGQLGERDLAHLVAVANGQSPGPCSVVDVLGLEWVARNAPSLDLVHLTRLAPVGRTDQLRSVVGLRAGWGTDVRVVEDALRRGAASGTLRHVMDEVLLPWAWSEAEPQEAWAWMLQQPDALEDRLASSSTATPVLRALRHAPSLPDSLLPALARAAAGASQRNRDLAQALLASHPLALDLAGSTLADPRAAVRRAGAAWLARLADPRAVGLLRQTYGVEKDWQVRAGVLRALEASGDDITDLLSPQVLAAQAARAPRRLPAALAWLDPGILPRVRWAGGGSVDPLVVRWWVVLAHRLKSPDGRGMVQIYLSLLDPGDAARLGAAVVGAWVARNREAGRGDSLPTKGLLAFSVAVRGEELAVLARGCLRANATRRAESEAVLACLRASAAPEAVQVLVSVSQRHRLPRVRDAAIALLEDLARERGWSAEELGDRTVPTAGFDPDGLLHLDYGGREFLGRVGSDLTIVLSDPDGRPRTGLPRARKDEDAERVAEARRTLTAARKEARAVLAAQTDRLYAAMCAGRRWPYPAWRDLLAAHPLVSRLLARLVWVAQEAGGRRTFRPAEDGVLLGADDEVVEPGHGAEISLAHGTLMSQAEAAAWRRHLADYEVDPLFDQLSATTPPTEPGQVLVEGLRGRRVQLSRLQRLMRGRGYQQGSFHLSWAGQFHKEIPAADVRAVIGFEGQAEAGETVLLGTLSLVRGQQHRLLPLDQVPPVLLAEAYADYMACEVLGDDVLA